MMTDSRYGPVSSTVLDPTSGRRQCDVTSLKARKLRSLDVTSMLKVQMPEINYEFSCSVSPAPSRLID